MIAIWNNDYTAIVYGTFLVLAAGYLARFLPFAIKAVAPFLEQIPPAVEESARLTGASFTKIVSEILLPLSKTGLISAWLVGFILCMRELELSVMLTPPGFQTLPNRIFTLYHYGEIGMTCALSLFLIVIVLIPYILLWSISRQNALPTIKKGE
jgi:iron(III) transport system permease protein